jgi:TonB-linked SusC/RagA family outer membrane protein
MKRLIFTVVIVFLAQFTWSQSVVTGTVTSADGEPLPGATVQEKGTTNGTVTDVDGNYTINMQNPNGTLVFNFLGFETQEVDVQGRSVVNVSLEQDVSLLEEVVVIGYGAQQERFLTSAISTVDSEEITKTPTNNAMQALQGKVAGVQIVSSGAPGSSPTVRIRGVGSFEGNAQPLFVVDGMFFDEISFLDPNDIATISVLKDASASAIYGMRAANGVVLIETKSGQFNQEPRVVYNGYYGVQNPQNVIKMSNAEQFVGYVNETGDPADISFVQEAFQRYGRSRINPNVPNVNTDWYDEIMDPAPIQNHSLNFYGGSEKVKYSVGGSYFSQDGLLNDHTRDEFNRFNFRTKIDFRPKEWLDVGGNFNVSVSRQYVAENAAWFRAYFAVPIIPAFDSTNVNAEPFQLGNAQLLGYRGTQNPFFPLLYNDNRNDLGKLYGSFFADIDILPNKLSFKTQYNYSLAGRSTRNVNFFHTTGLAESTTSLVREQFTSFDQVFDNFLTYEDIFGKHNLTVVGGYSYRSEFSEFLRARKEDTTAVISRDEEHLWFLNQFQFPDDPGTFDGSTRLFFQSFFGRVAYNYNDRYLFYSTFRRDGNNKFQEKWGEFWTFGAGWILSEENFFDVDFIDFLKLKASWGQLGNDNISPAAGAATLEEGRLTVINGVPVRGRVVNTAFDLIDRWETTEEWNFGLSATFLDNRLTTEANYFERNTEDLAVTIILPLIRQNVRRSVGGIKNEGLEFNFNWRDNLTGDFSYSIGGNFGTLDNEVVSLGGAEGLNAGSSEFRQRSIIGHPFQAFFGYEVVGVFQNEEQISNSGYTSEFIAEQNLEPGDFFFEDQNNDGIINDLDRVVIGSFLPDVTYGFNFELTYKNFDFSMLFQGQAGHDILNRKRGEIIFTNDTNLDANLINNLWRGEGTSNIYPSAAGLRKGWNQNMSEYFVEDGSFFRIQNIRLSYSLIDKEVFGARVPETRIILTAEKPLTVFDYNGFNPEVANGIDRQTYPIPAIYTIGLNIEL